MKLVVGSGEQDINMNIQMKSWFLKDAISCKQQIVEKYPNSKSREWNSCKEKNKQKVM